MAPHTIELDCPPGVSRPGDLIAGVIEGTVLEGLPQGLPDAAISRVYGCWTWDFSSVAASDWELVRPVIRKRIEALYNAGVIRYGSW